LAQRGRSGLQSNNHGAEIESIGLRPIKFRQRFRLIVGRRQARGKSEDGPIDARYNLAETPASAYLQRTEWNVRDSDATLVFTVLEKLDGESKRTAEFAERYGKPWMHCM
jgi:hypothetical protein